jgi:threonine synthase
MHYVSNKGGTEAVDFETAILNGFADNGGLYVPETLPTVSPQQLEAWSKHSYPELAFEILSLFISRSVMSADELRALLTEAYSEFEAEDIIPLYPLKTKQGVYMMELFHGPTLSFKDVGLAFLVNLVNFFLERKGEKLNLIVATTGDTGPATAHFSAGKSSVDAWVLYPDSLITEEQARQITTLDSPNVHAVAVSNCPDGGDDLDLVIASLFANTEFKNAVNLSSVNSINWGRMVMQTVHYFYAYLQLAEQPGERISYSVPSGAFGNLCAGTIARTMGLPVDQFIVANNTNACLHRIFSQGAFIKRPIIETVSSAIDILIPYNFWRCLYFILDGDTQKIAQWMTEFEQTGTATFDEASFKKIQTGFLSSSITDPQTLAIIKELLASEQYLLDPHSAVSVVAAEQHHDALKSTKTVCLATAHPAKFPAVYSDMQDKLAASDEHRISVTHPSIEKAKSLPESVLKVSLADLEATLLTAMRA